MAMKRFQTTSRLVATLCGGMACAGLLYTVALASVPAPAKESDSTVLQPLSEASNSGSNDPYRVRVRLVRNSARVVQQDPPADDRVTEPEVPTPAVAEPAAAEPIVSEAIPIAPPIQQKPLPPSPPPPSQPAPTPAAPPPVPTPAALEPSQPELLPEAEAAPPREPARQMEVAETFDIGFEPIGEIDVAERTDRQAVEVPPDRASEVFDSRPVEWSADQITWPVPASPSLSGEFCYRPLYFEEANLERYGNRCGFVQPVLSAARFYATIPALPYLAAASPPNECRYERFPYQAGASAPRVSEMPPLSVRGGLLEAGTAVGLIFLIP